MPLNEIGKEWVAALRSGEYKQGIGKLHIITEVDGKEEHKFCCLGVLSEILVKHFPEEVKTEIRDRFVDYIVKGSNAPAYNYLNDNLCQLAGFKGGYTGSFTTSDSVVGKCRDSLAARNDNEATFDEIASIIEENADQFFGK